MSGRIRIYGNRNRGGEGKGGERRARWLSSRSQAEWMVKSGIIRDLRILKENVFQRYSYQHPEGYWVSRVEAIIINPEGEFWERRYLGQENHKGDDGFFGNYFNEWEWIDKENVLKEERINTENIVSRGYRMIRLGGE